MIAYVEKGIGLHNAVTLAGHWLCCVDGQWQSSDDTAVQAIIDGYTLADAKAIKCAEIAAHAATLRDSYVANISPAEMASWPIKVEEARQYRASPSTESAPMLAVEAQARDIDLSAMVGKVEANSADLSQLEAWIAGVDGRHRDAVAALNSFAEVEAYDFSAYWPGAQS